MNNKPKYIGYGFIVLSALSYYCIAYHTVRDQFYVLFFLYSLSFVCFYFISKVESKTAFFAGLIFRLIFVFSLPTLSQDFYRFIWDGRLLLQGINPYLFTPNQLSHLPHHAWFIEKMGSLSAGNHSNYPPLNQLFFYFSALIGRGQILYEVLAMKAIIIGADLGIYFFGKELLKKMEIPARNILLYYLNPLVIIELSGNLHFEGVMMFLFCLAMVYLNVKKYNLSAVFFGLSVLVKLIPIFFIPLLYNLLDKKRFLAYSLVTGMVTLLGFLPFFNLEMIENYRQSVGLWFGKFEFNASFFYIIRQIVLWTVGYNINIYYGWFLKAMILGLWGFFLNKKGKVDLKKYLNYSLIYLSIYLFLATTVHPWYLVSLLFLNVFDARRFVFIWSFSVIFSYWAYTQPQFQELMWVLVLEYLPVFLLLSWKVKKLESW